MATIFNRKGKLYLQFDIDGKRRQKSTRLDDTHDNRSYLKREVIPELERQIVSGEYAAKVKAKQEAEETINKYAEKYLFLKEDKKTYWDIYSKVSDIVKHFNGRKVTTIKRGEVREYAAMKLQKLTPKTVRNYLGVLRGIFNLAIEYDIMQENPADKISLPQQEKTEVQPFTPEEMQRLIDAAGDWFKNFLAVSFYTGMRTGEAIGLMWSDIDFERKEITIRRSIRRGKITTPKTAKGVRTIPMFDVLVPYLKEQRVASKSLFVFVNQEGDHLKGADSMRKKWKRICSKAGVEYRKLYATRHTFITSMLRSGRVSIMELAQLAGHANTEPIMKNYARFISGEHLRIDRGFSPYSTDSLADSRENDTATL